MSIDYSEVLVLVFALLKFLDQYKKNVFNASKLQEP